MLGSRTDLHIFDAGSVNGTRYCNEILLPYVRLFRGAMGLQFLFMDDNAPCHRTVAAEQLLERDVETSESERYHLHERHALDAFDRPVTEKTTTSDARESRFNLSSDDNRVHVWRRRGERLNPAFDLQQRTDPTAVVCPSHPATACAPTPAMAPRSPFSTRKCSASKGKGVTKLSLQCYYPFLACQFPRFVSKLAYVGSFGTTSWASHVFRRTRGKVTANVERNVSRHHSELVYLNARSYRIVHSR
ncbi:transposable element Tcb1 transposase [Trichonephila clavipes]|nr:transposable element Tcb1 transposase [Trichonephila clavipes]